MIENTYSTSPKPFVFVLMPFDQSFSDIYKFGIKGAAEDAGAFAERVDEQIFTEGILERIFNQINKADLIVADMTGRNPNVFYEVGYAHALNKTVLLLTQNADDIPFDLKQKQHTVYEGSIEKLRQELAEKIKWALEYNKNKKFTSEDEMGYFDVSIDNIPIAVAPQGITGPIVELGLAGSRNFGCNIQLTNNRSRIAPPIEKIEIKGENTDVVYPVIRIKDTMEFKETGILAENIPPLPKGALHNIFGIIEYSGGSRRTRLHVCLFITVLNRVFRYPFLIQQTR